MICSKHPYESEAIAQAKLDEIIETGEHRGKKPRRVYMCYRCGSWHMTSSTYEEFKTAITIRDRSKLYRKPEEDQSHHYKPKKPRQKWNRQK